MSQPLKNIVNTVVFIRFHIFNNFQNLVVPGTILESIWEALGLSTAHFGDFCGCWRLLRILMNFVIFSEAHQAEAPRSGGGKMFLPRAHYYRQYGGYSIEDGTYKMEHGTRRLKGL